MSLATNQFFDINQLPVEEGIFFFGVSMNRIANRQSAENCFKDLQHLDTKIHKTRGIGLVMWYGDYLYFHSEEKAHILRDRYKDLMLSHKNAFMSIVETKPAWTMKAFSFMSFGQVMLDNSRVFQVAFQKIYDFYKQDAMFQEFVHFDCTRINADFDDRNILFVLEEITAFYLAAKGQLRFNNTFIQNTQVWILQGYPGKPLKSEVYLFQANPLKLSNPKNKYEMSYYDLDAKILYDYNRLDVATFDFNEESTHTHDNLNFEQEKENLTRVRVQDIEGKGRGLVAKVDFNKDDVVFVVHGDVITYATDYTIPINATEKVEPRISKSVAQYMNHSCEPNIYPSGDGRTYRALRPVRAGEELVTHYGFLGHAFGAEKSVDGVDSIVFSLDCHCKSTSCSGVMKAYDDFSESEKIHWAPYVLPFLREGK